MFNHHEKFGLDKVVDDVSIFFYDRLNTTFYVTDEQIEALLDRLTEWYINAKKGNEKFLLNKKIEEAAKQKKDAEVALKELEKIFKKG
jgi:hypothetical protein